MEEGKVGSNRIIIAGDITKLDFSRADYLGLHIEQYLKFSVERIGKLPEQWPDYYENVLVPLEITSESYKSGETVVFTREGRVIGGFEDFKKIASIKYGIEIDYPQDRIEDIRKTHIVKAQEMINQQQDEVFQEKVNALLEFRELNMKKLSETLMTHNSKKDKCTDSISEISSIHKYIQPLLDSLYSFHHYPTKESDEQVTDSQPTDEDSSKPAPDPTPPADDESQEPKDEEEEENKEKDTPPPPPPKKEEEDEGEPDPEAIELQLKLKETFKLNDLPATLALFEFSNNSSIKEKLDSITNLFQSAKSIISDEKFRWKKLEQSLIQIKEQGMSIILLIEDSFIAETMANIKNIEAQIDLFDNFKIEGYEESVLEAASIKFCATFPFV